MGQAQIQADTGSSGTSNRPSACSNALSQNSPPPLRSWKGVVVALTSWRVRGVSGSMNGAEGAPCRPAGRVARGAARRDRAGGCARPGGPLQSRCRTAFPSLAWGRRWSEVKQEVGRGGADPGDWRLRDGRRVSVSATAAQRPRRIMVVVDVTDQRRLQERAERQDRLTAMGEMAAQLAHQVRTRCRPRCCMPASWQRAA